MNNDSMLTYTPILGAPTEIAIQHLVTDDTGARFLKLTLSQLITAIDEGKLNEPLNFSQLMTQFEHTRDTTSILIPLDVYFLTPQHNDKRLV